MLFKCQIGIDCTSLAKISTINVVVRQLPFHCHLVKNKHTVFLHFSHVFYLYSQSVP